MTEVTAALDALAKNGGFDHGLKLTTASLTYEQLEAVGFMLGQAHRDVRLAMGDYLVIAEQRFPEQFSQAAEALNISEDGMLEYLRVSRAVPHSVRVKHPKISWSHYRAVASLKVVDSKTGEVTTDHKAQKLWLAKAVENQWSHHQFRAELKPADDEPVERPSTCRCCGHPL